MVAQGGMKGKKLAVKEKIRVKPETAPAKAKGKARIQSQGVLVEDQKVIRSPQAPFKSERRPRIKAAKDPSKIHEELITTRLQTEQERHGKLKRVSFIVRLTVDENNLIGRTEIEHISSNRKQNFLKLDGDRLIGFIKECIFPATLHIEPVPATPVLERATVPDLQHRTPRYTLLVSDLQVYPARDPSFGTLVLTPGEPFIIRARFKLQGGELLSPTIRESSYEIKVYVNELTRGTSKLLTTYRATLTQTSLEYTVPLQVAGLSQGLYRLFTMVTLCANLKIAGYNDELVIQVT